MHDPVLEDKLPFSSHSIHLREVGGEREGERGREREKEGGTEGEREREREGGGERERERDVRIRNHNKLLVKATCTYNNISYSTCTTLKQSSSNLLPETDNGIVGIKVFLFFSVIPHIIIAV